MRVENATSYIEPRDVIAQDWSIYIESIFPDSLWMFLPNSSCDIVSVCEKWRLDGIIFTGGNDIGGEPLRDNTEKRLLEYAIHNKIPILGVCRGIQFFQHYFNGKLEMCNSDIHVNNFHRLQLLDNLPFPIPYKHSRVVNSYHNWGIRKDDLVEELIPFAKSDDGFIEGVFSEKHPLLGIQWHPERKNKDTGFDRTLIRTFLNKWM